LAFQYNQLEEALPQRMDAHKKGWFTEIGAPKGASVALSILSRETLHREKSKYQDIVIFDR